MNKKKFSTPHTKSKALVELLIQILI